jgi:hypothetical protein
VLPHKAQHRSGQKQPKKNEIACRHQRITPFSRSRPCARAAPVLGESPALRFGES